MSHQVTAGTTPSPLLPACPCGPLSLHRNHLSILSSSWAPSSPTTTTAFWNVPSSVPLFPESQQEPHQSHYHSAPNGSSHSVPQPHEGPHLTHQSPGCHFQLLSPLLWHTVLMIPPLLFCFNVSTRKCLLGSGDTTVTRTPHALTVPHS